MPGNNDNNSPKSPNIRVMISNSRDSVRCGQSINSLWTHASSPSSINVVVSDHIRSVAANKKDSDTTCKHEYCKIVNSKGGEDICPRDGDDKLTIVALAETGAKGKSHSLAMGIRQTLTDNDDFCLTVSSHSTFEKDWDVKLVEMWKSIGNDYAIISTVPPPPNTSEVNHLCSTSYEKELYTSNAPIKLPPSKSKPILSTLWSSHYSFSKCHAEINVPFDPFLPYVENGWEFTRFVRFWTRGYDVYTPSYNLIYEDDKATDTSTGPRVRMLITEESANGLIRMHTMLGNGGGGGDEGRSRLGVYGLGKRRSLEMFSSFTGVDVVNNKVVKDMCLLERYKKLSVVKFDNKIGAQENGDKFVCDNSPLGNIVEGKHKCLDVDAEPIYVSTKKGKNIMSFHPEPKKAKAIANNILTPQLQQQQQQQQQQHHVTPQIEFQSFDPSSNQLPQLLDPLNNSREKSMAISVWFLLLFCWVVFKGVDVKRRKEKSVMSEKHKMMMNPLNPLKLV